MPSFRSRPRPTSRLKQRRGEFFPFLNKFQTQRDPVTITESLGTVVDSGTGYTLKFSTDSSSSSEAGQTGTLEEQGFPTAIVEFAPHSDWNEDKYAPTGFTDITQFVKSVNGSLRGRSYEVGRFEAGSISVGLDNHDGRFTPGTARSPYYPDIKANRRLRIRGKNMQNPNIATGGGSYQNTIGFRKATGVYTSSYASQPSLGTHSLFTLPYGIGTSHIETTLAVNATVTTHDLVEFYAPIELGVRLTHSAYVWLVAGTEAKDSLKQFIAVYYDADGNELTPVSSTAYVYQWTDETPGSPMRVHISDQPPTTAKYCQLRLRIVHRSMTNVLGPVTYAITGIQTEVPENNLAPLMEAINFSIEGAGNVLDEGENGVIIAWGAGAAGAKFRVPRMVPGDTYTFSATVKKIGVDVYMTADEGASGASLDNEETEIDVSASFVANRVEEEIKFIPLQPLPGAATNLALNASVSGSGLVCQLSETVDKAVNGSWINGLSDKFCTFSSPGTITVNLTEPQDLSGFIIRHARAGGETANYNTRDFTIATSFDNVTYTTVVSVTGNTEDVTIHPVECRGQYVKLSVTTPTQINDPATRIYEFEVYGTDGLMPSSNGTMLTIKNITVRKGDVTDLDIYPPMPTGALATEEENGVTAWEAPKPIFEGWTEDWPARANDLTSSTDITVNDRSARLGGVELSHTLREALFKDAPVLMIPFSDDPIDSQGKVSNLGSWSDSNGMTTIAIQGMNVDLTGASYTQGVAGPTTDNAIQFNRVNSTAYGYVVPVPYTPEYQPKLPPPSAETGPLPTQAEGTVITKNYFCVWSHTYTKDGVLTADDSTNPDIYQGDCSLGDSGTCSSYGDQRALVGFNYPGMLQELTGKTIRYVGLSVHAEWWWYFQGGYGVFGTHNYLDTNGPQTWSSSRVKVARWRTNLFRRDSWQTFSLGVEVGYEILAGTTTGIAIGPALSSALDYYGKFSGVRQRYKPYLTIQYTL